MEDGHDDLMDKAVELMLQAATLLGWGIAVHQCGKNKDFINGIVVGHPKYVADAIKAFAAIENSDE